MLPPARARRYLTVTQGNLDNYHLYLSDVLDLFPADVQGGSNKSQAAPRTVRILWCDESIDTDITQDKKMFRRRAWVRRFFEVNRIRVGDRILLEQVEPYVYRLSRADPITDQETVWPLQPEIDPGTVVRAGVKSSFEEGSAREQETLELGVVCPSPVEESGMGPAESPSVNFQEPSEPAPGLPPAHRAYLQRRDYPLPRPGLLTEEEAAHLACYGYWLEALALGMIAPITAEQIHFVQVVRGQGLPETLFERIWVKLQNQSAHPVPASPSKFEELADARNALLELRERQEAERQAILKVVQAQLDALEARYADPLAEASQRVADLEVEVKNEVLRRGESVRVGNVQVIFYRGRVTWDSRGLTEYAETHPEVEQFRKVGEPSASIRYR